MALYGRHDPHAVPLTFVSNCGVFQIPSHFRRVRKEPLASARISFRVACAGVLGMPKCNGTPSIGATASFFIRPTVIGGDILRDDYMIRQNFRDIGRIRFAPELSSQGRTLFARDAALGIFSGTFFEIIGYIAARP